jgi:hypothetical protein
MTGPVLVVELPEATASSVQAAAMIEACSSALRPGHCELPSESAEQKASAIAVVSFKGPDRLRALLEVGKRREDREVWLSEELSFRENDSSIEEYRAIGLTVAVLFHELASGASRKATSESDGPATARSEATSPEKTSPAANRPGPREASAVIGPDSPGRRHGSVGEGHAAPRAWLTVGALAGADPGGRVPRFGGQGIVGVVPVHPLVVAVSGHYQRAALAGVDLTFASLGIGVGSGLAISRALSLRGRAEVIAENVAAGAHDLQTNLTTRKSLWVAGLSGVLDLVWAPERFWGVSLTVAPERVARGTTVTLHDRVVGTTPATSIAAGFGVEIYPFGR